MGTGEMTGSPALTRIIIRQCNPSLYFAYATIRNFTNGHQYRVDSQVAAHPWLPRPINHLAREHKVQM